MQRVLAALLADPTSECFARDIAAAAQLRSGTIYPVLARLENMRWVESGWEQLDTREVRPARRCYRLTGAGVPQARAALAAARGPTQWRWRPAAGQS